MLQGPAIKRNEEKSPLQLRTSKSISLQLKPYAILSSEWRTA